MQIKELNTQLVKLPPEVELTLFLIREELKSCKLFNALGQAGFNDGSYRPDLGVMILEGVGFDEHSDELLDLYVNKLNAYSDKVDNDQRSLIYCAFDFYVDLLVTKRSRLGT